MILQILAYERYFYFLSPKNVSYFVQRSRIDTFEENSAGHFDAKIYSNISIKFALKKYVLTFFVPSKYFLFCVSIFTLSFIRPKT